MSEMMVQPGKDNEMFHFHSDLYGLAIVEHKNDSIKLRLSAESKRLLTVLWFFYTIQVL